MPAAPVLTAPGVYTIEQLTSAGPNVPIVSPSTAGMIGESWFGIPGVAFLCNNWNDFQTYFGGFNPNPTPVLSNPYLAYAAYYYFLQGGSSLWVQRVVSAAQSGAAATVTLSDSAGTPQPTLQLTAGFLGRTGNVGTWGNSLYWAITAMPTTGRFILTVYYGGLSQGQVVESWYDVSMNPTDSRYLPSLMNNPLSGSQWLFATAITDRDIFPTNAPLAGSGQFSGGIDPTSPPAASDWEATVTSPCSFDTIFGDLTFAMPGQTNVNVRIAAIQYAISRPYSLFVIDPPSGLTSGAAITDFQQLAPITSHAAEYWPWVLARNPGSSNLQSTILLPPSGFALGQMAATDAAIGPWKAPAGVQNALAGVIQAERVLTPTDIGNVYAANINPFKTFASGAVCVFGTRTMQPGFSSLYVNIRRLLNYVEAQIDAMLETTTFDPNDPATWSTVTAMITSFLSGLVSAGAFGGLTSAQSYFVTCDATNNSINSDTLNVTVGMALISPIEFIILTLSQFQGQVSVSASA